MPSTPSDDGLKQRLHHFTSYHTEHLARQQAAVTVYQAIGLANGEIAERLALATQTAQRHATEARRAVVRPEYDLTRDNAQFWATLHHNCCLATEFATLWVVG